jgi:hypothetical protein
MPKFMNKANIIISSIAILFICVVILALQYKMHIDHTKKEEYIESVPKSGCDISNFFNGKTVFIDGRNVTLSSNSEDDNYWLKQPSSYETMSLSQARFFDKALVKQNHYRLRLEGWGKLKQSYTIQDWGEHMALPNTCTFNQSLPPVPGNSTNVADTLFRINGNMCSVAIDPLIGDAYQSENLKTARSLGIETGSLGETCVLQINNAVDTSNILNSILNLVEKVGEKMNESTIKEFKIKETQTNANNTASNILTNTTIPNQEKALKDRLVNEATAKTNIDILNKEITNLKGQIVELKDTIATLKDTIVSLTSQLQAAEGIRAQKIVDLRNKAIIELKAAERELAIKEAARIRAEKDAQAAAIAKAAAEAKEKLRRETAYFVLKHQNQFTTNNRRNIDQCIDGDGGSLYTSGNNGCSTGNGYQLYKPIPAAAPGYFLLQHQVSGKCLDGGGRGNGIYFNPSCDVNNPWQSFTLPPIDTPQDTNHYELEMRQKIEGRNHCITVSNNSYAMKPCGMNLGLSKFKRIVG